MICCLVLVYSLQFKYPLAVKEKKKKKMHHMQIVRLVLFSEPVIKSVVVCVHVFHDLINV
jgi:hypothetical protein